MAGWTNKGKYKVLGWALRGETLEASFYLALTSDAPVADTNTLSDLTEITAGNGYTEGGQAVALDSTDFDTWTEDDTNDRGLVQLKDFSWTANGGSIPSADTAPRYVVLLDDHATPGSREVYHYWDMGAAITTVDGTSLILQDLEIRINES